MQNLFVEIMILQDRFFSIGERILKGCEEVAVAVGKEDVVGSCEVQSCCHYSKAYDLERGVDFGKSIGDAFPEHLPD